ncbi:hypothetical protein JCM3765_000140 [Sporobolomyces pararoseus]
MSLSTIPHELRLAIVRRLRLSLGADKEACRSQGRDLALVSSQWRTLGTMLSWEKFDLHFDGNELIAGEMRHVYEHLHLANYLLNISIDIVLPEESDLWVKQGMFPNIRNRMETERFATSVLPRCSGLRYLNMTFNTLDNAQLFLMPFCNKRHNPFPRLRTFTFIYDDTMHEGETQTLDYSVSLPCTALLEALPLFSSLEKLDLRLRSGSDADLPYDDLPSSPALPNLEHLRIDFAAFVSKNFNFTGDTEPTYLESEDYLLYVLSLPSPTRLRSLVLSVSILTSSTISTLQSFTSLTSLELRLEPKTLLGILDSIPSLLNSLNRLTNLGLFATHTIKRGKLINPSRPQLESLLSSLPTSLVTLTTYFDLSDNFQSVIDQFLNSRLGGSLKSWQYWDRRMQEEKLQGRRADNWELVLTETYKTSEGGELSWKKRARHFRFLKDLKHR